MKGVITLPDKPGSLCAVLRKVNPIRMSHIESLCEMGNPWSLRFLIEAEAMTPCTEIVFVDEFPKPILPHEYRSFN